MLPVFLPQCLFCNHANPAGAKFCNDCGSPLHLKLCNECEAINDRIAKNCYQCGTEFPVLSTAPEPVPAPDTAAASATLSDRGVERGHAPQPGSVAESHDVGLHRPGNETAEAHDHAVEVVTRPPRALSMTSLLSAVQRATDVIALPNVGDAARRRLLTRLALAIVLPVALLTTVGVSAYYVYRHQVQLSRWPSVAPPDPAAPTDVTASSVNPSGKRVTGPDGVNGPTPTLSQSDSAITPQLQVSTSDQAPAQQLVTKAAEVAKAPGAETAVAAEPRLQTTRAAGRKST